MITGTSILSGEFAEVFNHNCTTHWLPEGDDLQDRANALMYRNPLLETRRDCPIYRRHVHGHALVYHGTYGDTYVIFHTREAAEVAQSRFAASLN